MVDDELVVNLPRILGDVGPLVGMDGGALELEVSGGDGAQLGSAGEVVGQNGPAGPAATVCVEVVLEALGGVAPHGTRRCVGGDGPEELHVCGRWPLGEVEDSVDPGAVEGVGDGFDVAGEFPSPLACLPDPLQGI